MPAIVGEMGTQSTPSGPIPYKYVQQTYMLSSQARNWRFSARQIAKMRKDGNEAAQKRLREIWQRERELPLMGGEEEEPEASSSSTPIEFLDVDDEQALISYYFTRVRQLVKAFSLPELVEATTITFIKRFYLRNTCMDFHSKHIVLTCLFLAAKAESHAIPLRHFATKLAGKEQNPKVINENIKTVQDLEFLVSQSLAFEYTVHGAHRALHGFMLDFQTLQPAPTTDMMAAILAPARANVQQSRFTDAELIYTPSQIALACVHSSCSEGKEAVERFLEAKFKRTKENWQKEIEQRQKWRATERQKLEKRGVKEDALPQAVKDVEVPLDSEESGRMDSKQTLAVLAEIEEMISSHVAQTNEKVKEVDKKLKMCSNPERMSNSRLTRKHEEDKKNAILGKRDASRTKVSGDDAKLANPFVDEDDDDDEIERAPTTKRQRVA
ncbi:cyclin-like protein [Meira miltonrushii]|uniref:Cyclin-like protein n=1 Tax=Meira miltonrushii TaxID=1280837 RepID=A0A316VLU0_9BASI|nr:cyclin-like protein [Meira miltonrushii]PWN37363.1 cyclin-like protein [Meira miltonrushii]